MLEPDWDGYYAWMEWYFKTEEYDRSLPGVWCTKTLDSWLVHPLYVILSNDYASALRKQLRLRFSQGNARVREEVLRLDHETQRKILENRDNERSPEERRDRLTGPRWVGEHRSPLHAVEREQEEHGAVRRWVDRRGA